MNRLTLCLVQDHDLRLVALALLVAVIGSLATVQLVGRIRRAVRRQRFGWVVLGAVGTGTMVWSTHFVAMMAYRTRAPIVLDPLTTLGSLLLAIVLAVPGLAIASRRRPWSGAIGGAIVGVAISAMHYLGMAAYRVDGIVTWDWHYVTASVLLSCALAALAFDVLNRAWAAHRVLAALLLGTAVGMLHFTGMAAMSIAPLRLGGGLSDATFGALGVTTAFAGLLVVGCAAVSALLDSHTQSEAYRRLRRMALHDGLTDLPNRMRFDEELDRRLARAGGEQRVAVVMLDLSRFKAVNDTHGHQAGDQLLIGLAARLTAMLRPNECIARLGGDEFGALVSYSRSGDLDDFMARLQGAFAAPFVFERFTASIAANIGVALAEVDGRDADTLLAKADLAMYRAKSARSGEPCFYQAEMDDLIRDRRELADDLRGAVQAGGFEMVYQVQASIATGEITGYEALVRWPHPIRGSISPEVFIPLAEETAAIVPLSAWILHQACRDAAGWTEPYKLSVNLSPLHLSDPQLVMTVRQALDASRLPAERLQLELTESAIIRDRGFALEQLCALKAMGISIALDDFGVGYSSLDVLRSFPFDRIKLDKSFVSAIESDEQAVSILRSVAALGTTLHMPVLAEGIETAAQLSIVAREGCAGIQGYLIGRPARSLCDPEQVRQAMMLRPRSMTGATAAA